jgi:hypothetical protein
VARLHELGDVQQIQYEDGHAEIRVHVNGPNYGRVLQLDGIEILEIARRR